MILKYTVEDERDELPSREVRLYRRAEFGTNKFCLAVGSCACPVK